MTLLLLHCADTTSHS